MNARTFLKMMDCRRLMSLISILLLIHPALLPDTDSSRPQRQAVGRTAQELSRFAPRRPAVPLFAPQTIMTKTAEQITIGLPGQSQTLLPDGKKLLAGGVSVAGVVAAAFTQGRETVRLDASLLHARAWHTATVLPDGSVRIFGGVDSNGIVAAPESYDVDSQQFQAVSMDVTPRAYHTATVLTDGRVLFAGGIDRSGAALASLDLWDPATGVVQIGIARLSIPRRGHTARLLSDGNVLIQGGVKADGTQPVYDELFLADTNTVIPAPDPASNPGGLQVAASIPADGSANVMLNATIAVRFSRPVNVSTLNDSTVTLQSSDPVVIKVVPAEGGMLVFVTPQQLLDPNTAYTLRISGVNDTGGFALPPAEIHFTTAPLANNVSSLNSTSIPDRATAQAGRNQPKDDNSPTPLQGPSGVTSLYGAIRNTAGKYLPNVTVSLDCSGKVATGHSDSQGRFLLTNISNGHCVLEANGATAQDPGNTHGRFLMGVDLATGRTNVLPFIIWMTPIQQASQTTIRTNSASEQVITNPNLRGLELHLPPNSLVRSEEGTVVTQLSLTPVPAGRTPFPMPPGVAFGTYFTIQPAGAYVEVGGSRYTSGKGATLIYPNVYRAPAGAKFNFWDYDPDGRGWYIYGTGKVSPDRKSIVPDPGTVVSRFVGAMVAPPEKNVPATPNSPPRCPRRSALPAPAPGACADAGGDPVVPSTGLFYLTQTDLVIQDVLPVELTRTYRTGDPISRAFGVGTTHPYDTFLVGDLFPYTYMDLILPDTSRVHFTRISQGTGYATAVYQDNTTASPFHGATIRYNSTRGGWDLLAKNGTLYAFPDTYNQTILAKMGLLSITDRYGNSITMTRDATTGNLLKVTSPNGRWIAFTYDSTNRIIMAQDQTGRTYSYSYDESGRLTTVTDALGGLTRFTYDANNQMLTSTDPNQNVRFTNVYNADGRVVQQTAADNGVWKFAYTEDANGNIIQTDVTNPRGYIRRLTFDSNGYYSGGHILSETLALGQPEQQVTTYQYVGATGLLQSKTDALTRTTTYTYDSLANVSSVTFLANTPDANTITYTYDSVSNEVASVTDALQHQMIYTHNSLGELQSVTDATNRTVNMVYNNAGQVTSVTTPAGTAYIDYTAGLPSALVDMGNNRTSISNDSLGRITAISDAVGGTTNFQYDVLGRKVIQSDPLQAMTQLGYDANGNILSLTDALNNTTKYVYDGMNQVTSQTDPLQASESFIYDHNGNITQHTDRKQQVTQTTYDGLDRPTLVTFADTSTIAYTYDGGDRLTQIADSVSGTITRGYDGMDRLLSETTPQGSVTYTYDAAGRRLTMQVSGQGSITYSYDNANRPTQITQGSTTVALTYDSAGRRSTLTLPNGVVVTYGYDTASRLASIAPALGGQPLGNLTYEYDGADHRTGIGGSLARTGLPAAVTSASYNAANQLLHWGSVTLMYDAEGNLTSDGTNAYIWDARNQLASMTGASFQYDGTGRRNSKTIGGATTGFLYDGVNLVQELSGSLPSANLLTGLDIDELFQRTDSNGPMNFLTDANGSTVALLDASGNTQTQYTYDPFGGTTESGPANSNTFQFTGREDDNTGFYYYRARYYNPQVGRFVTEDPVGFDAGGVNLYAYVGGNPLSRIDPLGLDWIYHQGSGQLQHVDSSGNVDYSVNGGYSGYGPGLNNSSMQNVQSHVHGDPAGPIPQGTYKIGPTHYSPHTGPGTMNLDKQDGTNTFGRSLFRIHGDNAAHNHTASDGCIIEGPNVRNRIANSGDPVLRVLP